MKKINKIIYFVIGVCIISILNPINIYAAPNDDEVSTRELALMASLVYEDVPDDSRYKFGEDEEVEPHHEGCSLSNGNVEGDCTFKHFAESNVKLKNSIYYVRQYIEGMSKRKINSLVSKATAAFEEPGEAYYYLDFATANELENWKIVHYGTKATIKNIITDVDFNGVFDAITFNKGHNYVIAFRGTDYPDLFEWIQDISYAFGGRNKQAYAAYQYAQSEYQRIVSSDPEAKFYVVGHSLGAYLAQIGGAAIVDYEADRKPKTGDFIEKLNELFLEKKKQYDSFDALKADYSPRSYQTGLRNNGESRLVQTAYFNGMGVGGMFGSSDFAINMDNALVYLSTHNMDGTRTTEDNQTKYNSSQVRYVNYSSSKTRIASSGRLILYSIDADPVSDIGFHYGEIFKVDVAGDVIYNHNNTHDGGTGSFGKLLEKLLASKPTTSTDVDNYNSDDKKEKNGWLKNASDFMYDLLNLDNIRYEISTTYMPKIVIDKLTVENDGDTVRAYRFLSMLKNLSTDLGKFRDANSTKNIEIRNLFDHFNMNHETDSFACFITRDNNTGELSGVATNAIIDIKGEGKIKCTNNDCKYESKDTYYKDYTFGSNVFPTEKSYIIAEVTNKNGGCVDLYKWYYKTNGGDYGYLGSSKIPKIIIPFSKLKNTSVDFQIKVEMEYKDTYKTIQMKPVKNGKKYEKADGITLNTNPTLNDGRSLEEKYTFTKESTVFKFTTYGYVPAPKPAEVAGRPSCTFKDYQNNQVVAISIKKNTTAEFKLSCSTDVKLKIDDYSKTSVSKLSIRDALNNNRREIYLNNNDIRYKFKITNPSCSGSNCYITVQAPSESGKTAELGFYGVVKDEYGEEMRYKILDYADKNNPGISEYLKINLKST